MDKTTPVIFARRLLASLGFLAILGAGLVAAPAWEKQMNYQGQLTDSSGVAVADGTYSIQFLIYDVPTGSSYLWTETQGSVQVTKGLFNVVLGSGGTPIVLPASAYSGDLYLALNVNGNGEMSPRQLLLPSAYSYNSKRLDGNLIGTGAFNIPQLDGSGKLPSGLMSVPQDLVGAGGVYNLKVNNTSASGKGIVADSSSGLPVSATTNSTTFPAIYAEANRYGGSFKTNDAVNGVAVQAFGPGSAYASLIDKVNNAQVYASAGAAATISIYGVNTSSGLAVAGNSTNGTGVSGTGGTNGVYGSSLNGTGVNGTSTNGTGVNGTSTYGTGVYGTGNQYGVYGYSSGGYGVRADSSFMGIWASGTSYGTWSESAGIVGLYGIGNGSTTKAVWGNQQFGSGVNYGVYGQTNSGAGFGVYAENTNAATGATALWAKASTASTGVAILAQGGPATGTGVSATGGTYGVYGLANSATGAGGYFKNTNTSSPSAGIIADGYYQGISATADQGYAVVGSGYGGANFTASSTYGVYVNSLSTWGMNVNAANSYGIVVQSANGIESDSSTGRGIGSYAYGNSVDGIYSYTSGVSSKSVNGSNASTSGGYGIYGSTASTSNGYGVFGTANCVSCYGGYFQNTSATSGAAGAALYVSGGVFFGSVTGSFVMSAGSTSLVVSNAYIGSTDEVFLTLKSDPGNTVRYWVGTIVNGSFTVNFSPAPTNSTTISYLIVGD